MTPTQKSSDHGRVIPEEAFYPICERSKSQEHTDRFHFYENKQILKKSGETES